MTRSLASFCRHVFVAVLFAAALPVAHAQLYVANLGSNTVGAYDPDTGAALDSALISGLSVPTALAISGNNIYVANGAGGIGVYNRSSGAVINPTFITTGVSSPVSLALFNGNLYVENGGSATIGVFDAFTGVAVNDTLISGLNATPFSSMAIDGGNIFAVNQSFGNIAVFDAFTGASVNPNLLTGMTTAQGLIISGGNIYVADAGNNRISKISTSGTGLVANFITGGSPAALAVYGSNLYVSDSLTNSIGVYDLGTGTLINPALVSGLNAPVGLAVAAPVPEPGTWALVAGSAAALFVFLRRRRS